MYALLCWQAAFTSDQRHHHHVLYLPMMKISSAQRLNQAYIVAYLLQIVELVLVLKHGVQLPPVAFLIDQTTALALYRLLDSCHSKALDILEVNILLLTKNLQALQATSFCKLMTSVNF